MGRVEFAARVLGALLEVAMSDPAQRLCIDHADLPDAIWQRVAPHLGLEIGQSAIDRMIEESRYYSKDSTPRLFVGGVPEHRPVTDEMKEAAQRFAEPGYRALASRR
jgi:hypothetical protein